METNTKSNSINYGLYLGGILALLTALAYAVNLDLFTKWWFGVAVMLVVVALGVLSSIKSKALLNGFITFKGAFSAYFITVAIGLVISSVVGFVIFNIVDPDAANVLQEKVIEAQVEMMRGFGTPDEAIAGIVEEMEKQENLYSLKNILQGLAFQLIGYSVVGLIAALIVKKEPIEA
ncbi:DUF4199 domain-containing protein [Bizionia argentinensis JUB59]|uniref:DUF4199 domain-containing protein n=1 Tax=Bizionia argentinensis JUB59 TaxID=1046627 RepID=G2EC41_9FLAO|nr:DUF4199 domain-containing protein [Bizionia argentinensis]EGV44054.1 DUF4199 domain-containing protein [Bizionia argentinensis JUB59]